MKKLTATALLLLALVAITYRATHHPVYGPCKPHRVECERTLLGYVGNK
jgi:hypothetical protein